MNIAEIFLGFVGVILLWTEVICPMFSIIVENKQIKKEKNELWKGETGEEKRKRQIELHKQDNYYPHPDEQELEI